MKSNMAAQCHSQTDNSLAPSDCNGAAYIIWFTGLSGSGKSTLAQALSKMLSKLGERVCVLDGDALRTGLCSDLGFSSEDRLENIRRASEVAGILLSAGVNVIAAFISPLKIHRDLARSKFPNHKFIEIYCCASVECCEARDRKGLYAAVRRGEIQNFTGLSAPYEPPSNPDITVDTQAHTPEQAIKRIFDFLLFAGIIKKDQSHY